MSNLAFHDLTERQTRWNAMIDALRAPCYALGMTMAGFSTIAREAGLDFWMALVTSLGVWGMPGQVAFASLYAVGASLVIIFIAVSLANMRMLLMVVSAADMMHLGAHQLPLWKRVFWMHFLAITAWAHVGMAEQKYPSHLLLAYYQGFALTIFTFGIGGTILGYFLSDFLTPLAVVIGGCLSPIFFPFAGEWAILLAGVVGGSLASLYSRYIAEWHLEVEA
jgi:predicted branched-subunit amino acid permease